MKRERQRVLVVDDEIDIARLLVLRVRDAGFDAESAGTATAAPRARWPNVISRSSCST